MSVDNNVLETIEKAGHARRMGAIENYFAMMQRQQLYSSFCYVMKFNRKVSDKGLLFHAIRPLLLKYPILASTIVPSDYSDLGKAHKLHDYIKVVNSLKFKDLFLELPDGFNRLEQNELLKKLNEIVIPYEEETLHWRLAVLNDNTLIYISDHCLADGINGKNLSQDLEREFNIIDSDGLVESSQADYDEKFLIHYIADKDQISKLPPALDSVLNYKQPLWFIPEYICSRIVISFLCYNAVKGSRSQKHTYKVINIPRQQVQDIKSSLMEHERTKKITVTPYIEAAWLNAQYENGLFKNSRLQLSNISIPADARKYLSSNYDQDDFKYGANTSGNDRWFYPVKKFTWSAIDYFNEYIKHDWQTKRFLYTMGFLTYQKIAERVDQIVSGAYIGGERGNSVFSNIGAIQQPAESSKYKIQDLVFSQSASCLPYAFALSCIGTDSSGLNIVVTMVEGVLSQEKFEKLIEDFRKKLQSYSSIDEK